jgi:hypothetical protein
VRGLAACGARLRGDRLRLERSSRDRGYVVVGRRNGKGKRSDAVWLLRDTDRPILPVPTGIRLFFVDGGVSRLLSSALLDITGRHYR